ncbi:hypothetical protein AXG93_1587s1070 [Marchantia polymorpha subsp. ruderalis]|uniref:Uncharacterized protein n=1 Tax=Marchantia polymorpha subsp. ruderalis TaxID=1480154 RepID=A0A176WRG3_MARPO|nr:hypothetical protein AXG93_1587s1070 [Marchantia polymorpha subsp. ruderalis]
MLCVQVIPLLRDLNSKLGKYAGPTNVGSYVELVRNSTRVKVTTAHAVVEKENQLWEIETKYETGCVSVAFNEESRRVDELIVDLEKKDQTHAAEVATKVKALAECEAGRTPDLELIERLESKCNEMRSQGSLAE